MLRMTSIPFTAEPLWTRARAMFTRAVAAIGDASSIAVLKALPRMLRRQIVAWLYPLESIVRRLLIAEAAALHRADGRRTRRSSIQTVQVRSLGLAQSWTAGLQTRTNSVVAGKCASEDARSKIDRARPESWRASFSFALPRNPHFVPNSRAPRIRALWGPTPPEPPPRAPRILKPGDAPFLLARRFEALRRVLADPRPYAERLARILAREVRRYSAVVRRAVLAGPRTDDFDPSDPGLSLDALGAAFDAPEAFKDTS
jgi:hypothetical protein